MKQILFLHLLLRDQILRLCIDMKKTVKKEL